MERFLEAFSYSEKRVWGGGQTARISEMRQTMAQFSPKWIDCV